MRRAWMAPQAAEKLWIRVGNGGTRTSGAKQAAEKPGIWIETRRKHTSAAKADIDSMGFMSGINPRPTARKSFSAACKAWVDSKGLTARLKWFPFKALSFPAVCVAALAMALPALANAGPVLEVDFSNPGLTPAHWVLTISPDGNGHFRSERGNAPMDPSQGFEAANVDRDIQVSAQFAEHVFEAVHQHRNLNAECESHMKVAFQGWKKLTYSGPDGAGSCTFNYSKDKQIQMLGESLVAVAGTIVEGARLETLLQHDRLGLDKEMDYLMEAAGDGRIQQICSIRGILERLADDTEVMERVRKRARLLLARAEG